MSLITLQEVSLSFGGSPLLDRVNLQIEDNERICLVGRNGEGKSTLLNILAGNLPLDNGRIIRRPGLKTTMLAQDIPVSQTGTIYDVVAGGLGGLMDILAKHHAITAALANNNDSALLSELESIENALEAAGGWQAQQSITTVLSQLQLEADIPFSDLSGGLKRRVLLARALVCEPDLLLLDEPTNHLDIVAITWLEEFLLKIKCAIIFITHDRLFAGKLAGRILDLDRGQLTSWPGNYEKFLQKKDEFLAIESTKQKKFDQKISQEETWIRQGVKARRTRNQGRVRALLTLRKERNDRRELIGKARMHALEAATSGRLQVQAKNISFRYEHTDVIHDFSTTILRGDKVGIIGPNGCGKTTLLNVLLGEIPPRQGTIRLGTNIKTAYLDQHRAQLDDEKSVAENIADGNDTVIINERPKHIIGYLKDFLFTPERARSPVKTLSGGERNRLLLAKLFSRPANVLILDEPTNDLDVETLELLEELLLNYQGTVLLVSHDRAFLNNVVTSSLVFEGGGCIKEYAGGYDDWLLQKKSKAPEITAKPVPKKEKSRPKKSGEMKLSFKEKQELSLLPQQIENMEVEQQKLYDVLADPGFYQENGSKTAEVKSRLQKLEETISTAYSRWEELEAIPEK